VDKGVGGCRAAIRHEPTWYELRIRADRNPRPHVAIPKLSLLRLRDVLLLRIAKVPDFIGLDSLARQISQSFVLILTAHFPKISDQFQDGRLGYIRHSDRTVNAAALDERSDHLNLFVEW